MSAGSMQLTLEFMFAAVTPGSVEKVEGPMRVAKAARGCSCIAHTQCSSLPLASEGTSALKV